MSNAISINIGLNGVDPDAYNGWDGALAGCVNDALAMKKIADGLGYVSTLILDAEATADRIVAEIGQAAFNLDEGGIVLITFSGHGGQMPDVNRDEADGKDETWVCYDRQLIDDELYNLWSQFQTGARILVLSDSCHSGTVTRNREYNAVVGSGALAKHYPRTRSGPVRFKGIPPEIAAANYEENKTRYNALQFASSRPRDMVNASVILISGCQDNQLSNDGDNNGLFTGTLLTTWDDGGFSDNYRMFQQAIVEAMPSTQTPNYSVVGTSNPDFEAQAPFTVEPARSSAGHAGASTNGHRPIEGPDRLARTAAAPAFTVNPGTGRFYAVEVASSPVLFDNGHDGERAVDNFYGSWTETALMRGSFYPLPAPVWNQLRRANQLYYRIVSSSSAGSWTDYQVSNEPADSDMPAIRITD
jgi:metacaspase-1